MIFFVFYDTICISQIYIYMYSHDVSNVLHILSLFCGESQQNNHN